MNCQQFSEIMDSYVAGELLVETNHTDLRHLENCAACRSELAACRELRARVRSAVKNAAESQINPAFARRLEVELRWNTRRETRWEKFKTSLISSKTPIWAALAACLLIVVFFGVNRLRQAAPENTVVRQNQPNQPNETPSPSKSDAPTIIEAAWSETAQAAIGDHENCALHFGLKEKPIALDEASEKYGAFNKNLDKAVSASLESGGISHKTAPNKSGNKFRIVAAHSCLFEGRRFAHIVLRKGEKTISVLVTDADFQKNSDSDEFTAQSAGNLQTAGFRAERFAVFVVSDLNEQENSDFAKRLSPVVRRHLEKAQA